MAYGHGWKNQTVKGKFIGNIDNKPEAVQNIIKDFKRNYQNKMKKRI